MCSVSGAHGFNIKSVSPAYTAHFLAQDFKFQVSSLLRLPKELVTMNTACK